MTDREYAEKLVKNAPRTGIVGTVDETKAVNLIQQAMQAVREASWNAIENDIKTELAYRHHPATLNDEVLKLKNKFMDAEVTE